MNLRRVLLNAGSAVFQVMFSAALLFVVYGYIVRVVGVQLFGVWATVAASTSVAAIGGLGLSGGVVKFVAKYRALENIPRVRLVLSTSLVSVGVALGAMCVLGFYLLPRLLPILFHDPDELAVALELVPYVVGSFWLTSISAIGVSGVEGFNRIDLRAGIYTLGMVLYAVAVLILLPRDGIVGLVEAQILQGSFLFLTSWVVLGFLTGRRWLPPFRWSTDVFREVIGYGVNFQVISIAQILFEPTTKALLTRFGGAGATGIFEMANRLSFQARNMVDAAHRTLVPSIAELHELAPPTLRTVYSRSAHLLVLVASCLVPILVFVMPVVSVVWLGTLQTDFVLMATALSVAWMLSLLATPAYYANMGTGELRWNVVGTIAMATVNATFGVVLGLVFGAAGVVTAFILGILTGHTLILWEYHKRKSEPRTSFVDPGDQFLIVTAVALCVGGGLVGFRALREISPAVYVVLVMAVLGLALLPTARRHSAWGIVREAIRSIRMPGGDA